jgi:hypothetical protein
VWRLDLGARYFLILRSSEPRGAATKMQNYLVDKILKLFGVASDFHRDCQLHDHVRNAHKNPHIIELQSTDPGNVATPLPRVSFSGGKGLMNITGTTAQRYDRSAFRSQHGFWADFIHPTATVEGALFHALNTYDRAQFTFSFLQYAAHVPEGDFVAYLRALLRLPLAKEYFPDLRLENGRIVRLTDNGSVLLESGESTEGLLDYLNPSRQEIEDTEVIQSAKFIHWAQTDPEHRRVQVDIGVAHFKSKMDRVCGALRTRW